LRKGRRFVERDFLRPVAALSGRARPRVFDKNLAHQLSRDAVKMLAALPFREVLFDQSQVGFINQRGRLQRVAGPFTAQVAAGQFAQLLVDDRHQLIESGAVAFAPFTQQLSDFVRGSLHTSSLPVRGAFWD
jgi:hypothetical protein